MDILTISEEDFRKRMIINLLQSAKPKGLTVDELTTAISQLFTMLADGIVIQRILDGKITVSFVDGEVRFSVAEVAISTQKMHARGPMGLKELTTYKWIIFGSGQVRPW